MIKDLISNVESPLCSVDRVPWKEASKESSIMKVQPFERASQFRNKGLQQAQPPSQRVSVPIEVNKSKRDSEVNSS